MPGAADIGTKRLIGLAPDSWLRWVTRLPDVTADRIIGSELQWVGRANDAILLGHSVEHGEFLVPTEIQLRYNSRVPRRVRAYAALAEEKYNLPVYPVLINILPPPPDTTLIIAKRYKSTFMGLQARQDYRIINLWEVNVKLVFSTPLPALLPFVPVLKGGGKEAVIRRALNTLRSDEQLSELEPLLAFFATFMLDSALVAQIMRWDMAVLRESPWYNEIVAEGVGEGLQRGLLRVLDARFGPTPARLRERILGINDEPSLEQLLTKLGLAQSSEEFERQIGS